MANLWDKIKEAVSGNSGNQEAQSSQAEPTQQSQPSRGLGGRPAVSQMSEQTASRISDRYKGKSTTSNPLAKAAINANKANKERRYRDAQKRLSDADYARNNAYDSYAYDSAKAEYEAAQREYDVAKKEYEDTLKNIESSEESNKFSREAQKDLGIQTNDHPLTDADYRQMDVNDAWSPNWENGEKTRNGIDAGKILDWGKNVVKGAAEGTASGFAGAQRALYEGGQRARTEQTLQDLNETAYSLVQQIYASRNDPDGDAESYDYVIDSIQKRLKAYADVLGPDVYDQVLKNLDKAYDDFEKGGMQDFDILRYALQDTTKEKEDTGFLGRLRGETATDTTKLDLSEPGIQQQATKQVSEYANELSEDSAKHVQYAKKVAGDTFAGNLITDVAVNGLQMAGDAALALLVGPGTQAVSLGSMGLRTFGSSAQEAEANGADILEQLGYGTVKTGIEIGTELMFDGLAGIYGKGGADEIVEEVIRKISHGNEAAMTGLRVMFGAIGEGAEEGVSGIADPFAKAIYQGIQSIPEGLSKEQIADILYDMLVGAASGGAFSTISAVTPQNTEANARLRDTDTIQATLEEAGVSKKEASTAASALYKAINGEELTKADAKKLRGNNLLYNTMFGLNLDENGKPNQSIVSATEQARQEAESQAQQENADPAEQLRSQIQQIQDYIDKVRGDANASPQLIKELTDRQQMLTQQLNQMEEAQAQVEAQAEAQAEQTDEQETAPEEEQPAETAQPTTQPAQPAPAPIKPASREDTDSGTGVSERSVQERLDRLQQMRQTAVEEGFGADYIAQLDEKIAQLANEAGTGEDVVTEESAPTTETAPKETRPAPSPMKPSSMEETDSGTGVSEKSVQEQLERLEQIRKNAIESGLGEDVVARIDEKIAELTRQAANGVDVVTEQAPKATEPAPSPIKPSSREKTDSSTGTPQTAKPSETLADAIGESTNQTAQTQETQTQETQTEQNEQAPQEQTTQAEAETTETQEGTTVAPETETTTGTNTEAQAETQTETQQTEQTNQEQQTETQEQQSESPQSEQTSGTTAETESVTAPETNTTSETTAENAPESQRTADAIQADIEMETQTIDYLQKTNAPQSILQEHQDAYQRLVKEYGAIVKGENPARDISVPRRTTANDKVSESVRTIMEAEATPDERLPTIQAAVVDQRASYVPVSNSQLETKARLKIQRDGWRKSLRDWTAQVRAGKSSADLVAEGAVLLNNAANNPDCSGAEYIDIMLDYVQLSHNLGRGLAAERILKTLTPEGRLYAFQRVVEQMNEEAQKRNTSSRKAQEETADGEKQVKEAVKKAKTKTAKTVFTFEYTDEAAKGIAKAVERKATAKPQAQRTAMEQLTQTIARFATEKIPSRKTSNTMTATDVLAEFSNNEEFAREAYEMAQQYARESGNEAVSEFVDSGLDLSDSNFVKRAVAETALATNENRETIRKQSALGISDAQIAEYITNTLANKVNASPDIKSAIREAALDYVGEILSTDEKTNTERVSTLVKQVMSRYGERFNNLAKSNEFSRDAMRKEIVDALTLEYGVDGRSAGNIADAISDEFETRLQEAINEELENRFGDRTKEEVQRAVADKLAEAVNLGAFNSQYAEEAVRQLFGVEGNYTLDPALVEEYRRQTDDAGRDAVIEKMEQSIADQIPSTVMDKFTAFRYLNMLGNVKTQVRNVLGNTGMMAVQKVKNTIRSTLETVAQEASGGKYQKQYSTTYSADQRAAARADYKNNKDVQSEAMGERKYSDPSRRFSKGIEDKRQIFKYGDNAITRTLGIAGKQDIIGKGLSLYQQATNWAMETGDQIFVAQNYTDALAGWMNAHDISGEQWLAMVAEADADPSSNAAKQVTQAREFAVKQAQEATFRDTNNISKIASDLGRHYADYGLAGKVVSTVAEGIVPFRKTPANVAVRMEEYSPLGIVNTAVKAVQLAKGNANVTGTDVIDSLSKTLTGTGLAIAGFALAAAGKARTKSDDDKQEAFDKLRGLQDYSITVNGHNYTFDWATPASASLSMGIELYNLTQDGTVTASDAMRIMGNLTSPMLEMSLLSGLNDALSNVSSYNGDTDTDALPKFILNSAWSYLTQGLTSTLLGQAEQASEQYRQTYYTNSDNPFLPTFMQKNLAKAGNKTPGVDFQAADYIDAWGRKQENGNPLYRAINAFVNPSYITNLEGQGTPVDDELNRLYEYGKDKEDFPNVFPQTVSRGTQVNDERLTPEEYDTFATTKGQKSLELVQGLMDSKYYDSLSDEDKATAVNEMYSVAMDMARAECAKNRGQEYSSSYQDLLHGVNKPGTDDDRTPLQEKNLPDYVAFKTAYSEATNSENYKKIDSLLNTYGRMNSNEKTVLKEHLKDKGLGKLLEYKSLGIGSKSYYTVRDAVNEAQEILDINANTGADVRLMGLANANIPESEKRKIITSIDGYIGANARVAYNTLSKYGLSTADVSSFFHTALYCKTWKDTKKTVDQGGTLKPDTVAYALTQIEGLTDQQRSEIYNGIRSQVHSQKYNDWKNFTYSSEVAFINRSNNKATYAVPEIGGKSKTSTSANKSFKVPMNPIFASVSSKFPKK